MDPKKRYSIGIDAGSKTIKIAVLDENKDLIHHVYKRHRSNIVETLREMIHDLIWKKGDLHAEFAITGSAGIGLSDLLNIEYTQEVIATIEAVDSHYPDADIAIELGGEDAKVIYLTGGAEQRMNATCAGGTGGFLDTVAFMLGERTDKLNTLALGANRIYPIASRCAVFAQSDIRPLLNKGATKNDIAASAIDAVVRQTLGGLACGRPIKGKVIFLGGPFEYIDELARSFRRTLKLDKDSGVCPQNAHLYPAIGAALHALRSTGTSSIRSLSQLEAVLSDPGSNMDSSGLPRLEPLFENEEDLREFQARHKGCIYPAEKMHNAQGPLYLGMDCGSTTVKLALIDEDGKLLYSDYQPSRGETVDTVVKMLSGLYTALPKMVLAGKEKPYIAHSTVTGYGEEMLLEGFGFDSGTVETMAHVRAAKQICPDATFVLDIGGQDMKALWLNGDYVSDAVLNEACSSGCGAFVDGTAHSLRSDKHAFAKAALRAKSPVDLGMRCTVFMSSRVKHAQKIGATFDDIAAGVAYSVVNNALYRIIGRDRLNTLGDRIVVQGGTFMSDAILRAFELTCGVEVMRSDKAHLMGAIGAALIARDRRKCAKGTDGLPPKSDLVPLEDLGDIHHVRRSVQCAGCANGCRLSVLDFGNGRQLVTGNSCSNYVVKGLERKSIEAQDGIERPHDPFSNEDGGERDRKGRGRNLIAYEQALLRSYGTTRGHGGREGISIGIIDALEMYRFQPFWHRLFTTLGFSVVEPERSFDTELTSKAWETVPAESVCYPAKISHAKALSLIAQDADILFFPYAERGNHCAVSLTYPNALADSMEAIREGKVQLLSPKLSSLRPKQICDRAADLDTLKEALSKICASTANPLSDEEFRSAIDLALHEQVDFESKLQTANEEVLAEISADPDQHAILLAGRPYHIDEQILHSIDEILVGLGFHVLGVTGLTHLFGSTKHRTNPDYDWSASKRLMKAADFVLKNDRIDLVCLQSFGCGYDAMSIEEVHQLLEKNGRPFTALKIDEMVETAHLMIRLRTLAESIASRSEHRGSEGSAAQYRDDADVVDPSDGFSEDRDQNVCRIMDEPIDEEDFTISREYTLKDVCFSADILAAKAIRAIQNNPDIDTIVLPEVCKGCLNKAIPRMVERATGKTPSIIWEKSVSPKDAIDDDATDDRVVDDSMDIGHVAEKMCIDDLDADVTSNGQGIDAKRPKIGIIGNPLLVFDPFMNDNLVSLIERLGCDAVLPDESTLYCDEVNYFGQLRSLYDQGVDHTIYLQSFGCVKGHAQARGSHYKYLEMFPDMPITVLDYDPEASALNRENRIRLIVESVMKMDR